MPANPVNKAKTANIVAIITDSPRWLSPTMSIFLIPSPSTSVIEI